jgi:CheY-like chemotaxis protein
MARILVVDDEEQMTTLIRRRLEANGYDVEEAWSGSAAKEKILAGKFDLILLDFSMPSMPGDELCRELRENERFKDLPIIILTAFQNRAADTFKEDGATDVMYKPIDTDELLGKLQKYLPNS